jgi:hypothetical protein
MKITWKLTHDASPQPGELPRANHKATPVLGEPPLPDFTAFDGDEPIGRVYQFTEGHERGLWVWNLTATRPGPASDAPTSGVATERGKAGLALARAYRAMVERSWRGRIAPGSAP